MGPIGNAHTAKKSWHGRGRKSLGTSRFHALGIRQTCCCKFILQLCIDIKEVSKKNLGFWNFRYFITFVKNQ